MVASDVASRLAKGLSISDLSLTSTKLEKRIDKVLKTDTFGVTVCQVRGLRQNWVLTFIDDDDERHYHSYYIAPSAGKVRMEELRRVDGEGWRGTEFRWFHSKLVGLAAVGEGNSSYAAAMVWVRANSHWKRTFAYVEDGQSNANFVNAKALTVSCQIRDYGFDNLSQPHAGPLLTRTSTWTYRNGAFHIGKSNLEHNAIYAFDQLVSAWDDEDWQKVVSLCPNAKFRKELRRAIKIAEPHGSHYAVCPLSVEYDSGKVFGLWPGDETTKYPFFEMGLVNKHWQVIRVASEQYFVKRDHIKR